MGLKIITLVKQVPDTHNVGGEAMKADGTINRAALPAIFNPEDLNALEEALKIKDALGAKVTAISLGPPGAQAVLQESLYRGADEAILVTDPKFAASDTLATSYALQCAIDKVGPSDLIFCGRQAIDGDTAQVGPQIAEKLGINQLTCVAEILKVDNKGITVKRLIDGGYEILQSRFPVLISVVGSANEPRFPSVKRVMFYKNINCASAGEESYSETYLHPEMGELCSCIKRWSAVDIKADVELCGLQGSPTKVKKIESVVLTAKDTRMIENTEVAIGGLIYELVAEHILG